MCNPTVRLRLASKMGVGGRRSLRVMGTGQGDWGAEGKWARLNSSAVGLSERRWGSEDSSLPS